MTTPLGSAISSTPPVSTTTATVKTAKAGESAMGPDAFMKLLVAQLKYQNPMAPADGQAYMTQMATFTQVEKLDQLVKAQAEAQQWQQRVSAEGLVGRTVSSTSEGTTVSGTVTGVRYAADGPLLELSNGTTMLASVVDHVQAAGAAPTTTTTTPTTTPVTSTTGSTSTTGGTGTPAATPSA